MLRLTLSVALLALAACNAGPDYQRPADNIPAAFSTSGGLTPVAPTSPWWLSFHDAILTGLIDRARVNNPDILRARAATQEARATVAQAQNGQLPLLAANAGLQATRAYSPPSYYAPMTTYGTTGFDASWELDLWGKARRSVEAARANAEGAEATADDAMLTLLGDVARTYGTLRGQQAQLASLRADVGNQRRNADLVRTKQRLGDGTDLEVVQAETDLAQSVAEIPSLEAAIHVSQHALAILCGDPPETLAGLLALPAPVPVSSLPQVPIPADLIRRRADVRAAERALAAATAQVGVAQAGRYPSLSLSGSLSFSGTSLPSLLAIPLFAVGPSLNIPILDGKGAAVVDAARARVDQARHVYRAAVLRALQEVEDAMATLKGEQAHRQRLRETVRLATRGVAAAHAAFLYGLTDFLSIITAQRTLDQTRMGLAQSEAAVMVDTVALFKALGGGYAVDTKMASEG